MKKSIQVNPEIIEQLAREMFNELEENAIKTGGKMTFDYIEGGVLQLRQKLGVQIMQRVIEMLGTGKIDKKKLRASQQEKVEG